MYENVHKNVYQVKNRSKYIGSSDKVFYMSGWEYSFFSRLEENPKVVRWNANAYSIRYISPVDNRVHSYFLDVYAEVINNGNLEKYLIEIKPDEQLWKPNLPKKKTPKAMMGYQRRTLEWVKNQSKWEAAVNFSRANGMFFLIVTELAYYTYDGRPVKLKDERQFR